MFDQLSDRLGAIFSRLYRSRQVSARADVNEALREVRVALLEADVSLPAAKAFVARVKEKALGANVLESLTPAQTIVKIVHDELVALLGGAQARLQFSDAPPSVIMLVGLQGSGKTTQAGKLALRLKEQGRRSLLVAADVYRPAAIAQLQVLGWQIDLPVFERGTGDPVEIARDGVAEAKRLALSTVIVDTAGRLQIDDDADGRTRAHQGGGQAQRDPVRRRCDDGPRGDRGRQGLSTIASGITGVILTKMDGDTRGGAALSIHRRHRRADQVRRRRRKALRARAVLSRPLGVAHPRHGRRAHAHREDAEHLHGRSGKRSKRSLPRTGFTLDDFLEQMRQVRRSAR